jgi:DNA-binding NarL/FixJ family response regulator
LIWLSGASVGICGELLRVLVAEDYEAVRKAVCAILRARSDIEVCGEAENGQEAVQKANALKPDLIILDLTIPMLSGFEAAGEIRKTLPDVPILILSMHESELLIEQAKKIGVQGYVIKREVAKTLLLAVDALMSNQTFYADII